MSNQFILKEVNVKNLEEIDVLIGASGKMYLPTLNDLKDESFALVKPYKITSDHTKEEIKKHWDNKGEILFVS